MSSGSEMSTSLSWVETFVPPESRSCDELLVQVHPRGAYRQRIPGGNSGDYGKGVVFCGHRRRRQVQQNAVSIDQAYGVALANEGHRRAFDDGDAQLIGQQPHHGRMFHPGQLFQCRAALAKRDEEDIAAQVGSENGEQLGSGHLAVAHDLDGGRGGDAEAGIVTEKVTYGDRQQGTARPSATTTATAARMRPARVGGMRPRRTGTRRRARRKLSSSLSGSPPAACSAGLRLPVAQERHPALFWRAPSTRPRGGKTAPPVHRPRIPLHGLLVSRFLPRPSQVVRFAIQTITWFSRDCSGNFRES